MLCRYSARLPSLSWLFSANVFSLNEKMWLNFLASAVSKPSKWMPMQYTPRSPSAWWILLLTFLTGPVSPSLSHSLGLLLVGSWTRPSVMVLICRLDLDAGEGLRSGLDGVGVGTGWFS